MNCCFGKTNRKCPSLFCDGLHDKKVICVVNISIKKITITVK